MKNKRILALVLVLLVLFLAIGLILKLTVPKQFLIADLKMDDEYQVKGLEWGIGESATKLSWFKIMKPDAYGIQLPDNEEIYISAESCVLDGQKADVYFYFRDGSLYLICFTFPTVDTEAWFSQQLEAVRKEYGQEAESKASSSGITVYKWFAENTQLQLFSPPTAKSHPVMLIIGLVGNE